MQAQLGILYRQAKTVTRYLNRKGFVSSAIEYPSYVCNSIGGVASTSVFDFLGDNLPKVTENKFRPGTSQWKHTLYPPISPSVRKGIFLFGDPMQATASLFRRNLCRVHLANKGLPSFALSFEDYLDLSHDVFRTSEHIKNWTAGSSQYPVLCVKSEAVFENGEKLCDFFGIDRNRERFPRRQDRSITTDLAELLGERKHSKLRDILSEANSVVQQLPDIFVVEPGSNEPTSA